MYSNKVLKFVKSETALLTALIGLQIANDLATNSSLFHSDNFSGLST